VAREILALIRLNHWTHVELRCLPAKLHSTPEKIAGAVDAKLQELAGRYERVFVAYADCGTGGALDTVLERHGVERCPARTATASSRERRVGRDARGRAGDLLPHRFPRPALRRARRRGLELDRTRSCSAVLRQLPRLVYLAQTDDEDLRRVPRGASASVSSTSSSAPGTATSCRR
jgi:hypothetical protein